MQIPELVIQSLLSGLMFLGRKWLVATIPWGVTLWCFRAWTKGTAYTDVTEIFRQAPEEKKKRFVKLGIHLFMFIVTIYR